MLQQDQRFIKKYFYGLISRNISESAVSWLDKTLENLNSDKHNNIFFSAFSMAPRFVGKTPIKVEESDLEIARQVLENYSIADTTNDQIARLLILLYSFSNDTTAYLQKIDKLISAADVYEQVAFYKALPFLPHPELFAGKAAEGLRSNMTPVFDTIALENPYPSRYLPENAWNQMVLKTIFTNRPLFKIIGFDNRRNAALSNMLLDFAHERWAANRVVSPELWRAMSPFVNDAITIDLLKVYSSTNIFERHAAALVIDEHKKLTGTQIIPLQPDLEQQIRDGKINWLTLGRLLHDAS